MFSLIITIISIALVAALAVASIYYGGSAFLKGSDGAKAAQFINEGQQINAAATLAKADSNVSATQTDLVSKAYLAQPIANWDVTFAGTTVKSTVAVSPTVCAEVNKRAGVTPDASGVVTQAQADAAVYGCVISGTAAVDGKVQYRMPA